MELVKQQLFYRKKTAETILLLDESTDSIIPDTLPDAERILDVSALAMIRDKQPRQDALSVKVNAVVTVLYLPEHGDGICSVQIPMPCTVADTADAITPTSELMCTVLTCDAQARMLNPRKISVHISASIKCISYDNVRDMITNDVSDTGSAWCERKKETITCEETVSAITRSFSVSEEVSLTGKNIEELLKYQAKAIPLEVKTVTNKVAIKGELQINALCILDTKKTDHLTMSVPFTQIMDVGGIQESAKPKVSLSLRSFDLSKTQESTDENAVYIISAGVCADVLLTDTMQYEILTDLYSTKELLSLKTEPYHYLKTRTGENKTYSIRETISVEDSAIEIVDVNLSAPIEVFVQSFEEDVQIPVLCRLIFLDENNVYQSATRKIFVPAENLQCGTYVVSLQQTSVQIGVDSSVVLQGELVLVPCGNMDCSVEQIVQADSLEPIADREACSVLLRRVEPSDSLWKLGKRYHIPSAAIKTANCMADDQLPVGSMLMIPMSR